jgi:RimJ/RimL family protein N-acetyltransferase
VHEDDVATLETSTADDPEAAKRLGGMSYRTWWQLVRDDPNRHGWIVVDDERPVGYLDAERDGARVWIALLVFRHSRGRGYAAEIARLALGEGVLASAESVVGAVEQDNVASWRAATAAGFTETGVDDDGLVLWTRKIVASQ